MILPLGSPSPDTAYHFSHFYGTGYRMARRRVPKQAIKAETGDVVNLSTAARRIMDQAERLERMRTE